MAWAMQCRDKGGHRLLLLGSQDWLMWLMPTAQQHHFWTISLELDVFVVLYDHELTRVRIFIKSGPFSSVYFPDRNCKGGWVISGFWIFYQAFQFITTPPPLNYNFGKKIFWPTKNWRNSLKFVQFLAKFRSFSMILLTSPNNYNPPNYDFGDFYPPPNN